MYTQNELYFSMIPLLFKPLYYTPKFLELVVKGEQAQVEKMLKAGIKVLFERASVTDCSGRIFSNISGFEYAIWAIDKHMWSLMLDCVKELPFDARIAVVNQLLEQYKKIINEGISYTLNGQVITEHHFDFENTIIKELKTQIDAQNASEMKDWDAIDAQWKTGVGGAQKLLPMHVVYEYCTETPFSPTPDFITAPTKGCRQFHKSNGCEDWFMAGSKLGVDFAIAKGDVAGARGLVAALGGLLGLDLAALETLCKVRTADFNKLEEQLEALLQDDCVPAVSQQG